MSDPVITTFLVLNHCYGGFSLSNEGERELAKRKGWEVEMHDKRFVVVKGSYECPSKRVMRNDPDLIDVVRLGKKYHGECAKLEIVEYKITIEIESSDGMEHARVYGSEQN